MQMFKGTSQIVKQNGNMKSCNNVHQQLPNMFACNTINSNNNQKGRGQSTKAIQLKGLRLVFHISTN